MIEITLLVGYHAGSIGIEFDADSYPDWWSTDIEWEIEQKVKEELLDISSIHEWRDNFETAQQYSMPGQSIKPEVGVLTCEEDTEEYEFSIDIDSVAELEGF